MQITNIKAQSFQLFMKAVTCSEIQAILNMGEKPEVGHVYGTAHFVHLNIVEKGQSFSQKKHRSTSAEPKEPSWAITALCRVRKLNSRLFEQPLPSYYISEKELWNHNSNNNRKARGEFNVKLADSAVSSVKWYHLPKSLLPIQTFFCIHKLQVCSCEAIEFHDCTFAACEFVSRHFHPHNICWELCSMQCLSIRYA